MSADWFRSFMDAAPEVYFRYAFEPRRQFVYVSRAIESISGFAAGEFLADPAFCLKVVRREDRRVLKQIARARRSITAALHLQQRDGTTIHVEIRTVPVLRDGRLIAVEGVARAADAASGSARPPAAVAEPIQQRLAALLCEVHDLLHGVVGSRRTAGVAMSPAATTIGLEDIQIDPERMQVRLGGQPIALTSRELLVLKYFVQHVGRVVTRQQLLVDVWGYRYTGDARTVDVHVSRLRHKLPPLRRLLRAVKHVGYVLDPPETARDTDRRIAKI